MEEVRRGPDGHEGKAQAELDAGELYGAGGRVAGEREKYSVVVVEGGDIRLLSGMLMGFAKGGDSEDEEEDEVVEHEDSDASLPLRAPLSVSGNMMLGRIMVALSSFATSLSKNPGEEKKQSLLRLLNKCPDQTGERG